MTASVIYLDHQATTPCDPRVVEAMLPTFAEEFGNAASHQHVFGIRARALVDRARDQVAALIDCEPREIVFTSGATESDNLAIKGVALHPITHGRHIVTSAIEHKAVLDSCQSLESSGFEVTYILPAPDGTITPEAVDAAIRDDTALVSIMCANNEIGTINPVAEIGAVCKCRRVLFHCDAVQALPFLRCDVARLGIDLLSISAHKMYGPKGIGALYVRRRAPHVRLLPLLDGGGHERGLRSGTANVPGIVGLGAACELARLQRNEDARVARELSDRLLEQLRTAIPDLHVNGSVEHRLPNNLNVSFPRVRGDALIGALETVAVSSGSACSSAARDGSHVLRALGADAELVESSIRISPGRFTTRTEIDTASRKIIAAVTELRDGRPS